MKRILTIGTETLHDKTYDDRVVVGAKVSSEENKVGTLTFDVYPSNPMYYDIACGSTWVTLCEDGHPVMDYVVETVDTGTELCKSVSCSDFLSVLEWFQLPPYICGEGSCPDDVNGFVKWAIDQSNISTGVYLSFGVFEGDMIHKSPITFSSDSYSTPADVMKKVVDTYGGYFVATMENGVRTVDLRADATDVVHQRIEFGNNLLEYSNKEDSKTIITSCTAESTYKLDNNDITITLDDLPDGDYLEGYHKSGDSVVNVYAANSYGIRQYHMKVDGVTDPYTLMSDCEEYISSHCEPVSTITVTAVDLSNIDPTVDRLELNSYVRVTSSPHRFDAAFKIQRIVIDMDDPTNDTFTMGHAWDTASAIAGRAAIETALGVGEAVITAKAANDSAKATAERVDSAVMTVEEQYYVSTSPNELTGGSWSDYPPTWASGKWIWSRSMITHGDGSQSTTPAICVTGNTGGGVESVDVMYYMSSSASDLLNGSWVSTYPGYEEGYWLWTKTVTTYTDSTQTVSSAACITGSTGQSAVIVEMLSDNGTVFKNGQAISGISITVWFGTTEITNISMLRSEFGAAARLLWWERGNSDNEFLVIPDTDTRLSEDGFKLAVDATEVTDRVTYRCSVDF